MNKEQTQLFKKLLPGFIPIFVFILIDEIWGTRAGLIAALIIGVGELGWIGIREKRFDKFVLLDTTLLVVLGGISIILDNDIFFKIKPALIELILCAILAFSAFSKVNIVALMSQRYMKDVTLNNAQLKQMKKSIKLMFYVFLVHTVLVAYSAFYMSDAAWAFISGGLFYILFGIIFIVQYISQKMNYKKVMKEEQLPLVDEQGKVIGKAPRSVCHNGEKLLHPVVHLHVLNENNDIYLQKRPMNKLVQPDKWDTAVGGHIAYGEDVQLSLRREAQEEIGLVNFSAKLLKSYVWESKIEKELVYVFITNDYKGINIHSDEVEKGKFWSTSEVKNNIGKGVFTPNFEHEFKELLS